MRSIIVTILLLTTLACSKQPKDVFRYLALSAEPTYINQGNKIQFESSISITVSCLDGKQFMGGGVAIGPKYVVTARHLAYACKEAPSITTGINIYGKTAEFKVDATVDEVDAVRLVVKGKEEPFKDTWAKVRSDNAKIGEWVCSVVLDRGISVWVQKCGKVSFASDEFVLVGMRIIPGNSGMGIFDGQGHVLGIWNSMHPQAKEYIGLAAGVGSWKSLVPKQLSP